MSNFTNPEIMDQMIMLRAEIDKTVNDPTHNERIFESLQNELREWTDELEGRDSTPSMISQSIFPDNAPETDEKFDKSKYVTIEQYQYVISALTKLTEAVENLQKQISNYPTGRVETMDIGTSTDFYQKFTTEKTREDAENIPTTNSESSSVIDTAFSNHMEETENNHTSMLDTASSTSEKQRKIQKMCYYHKKFGNNARRCAKECIHRKRRLESNFEIRLQRQISELKAENACLKNISRKNAEIGQYSHN